MSKLPNIFFLMCLQLSAAELAVHRRSLIGGYLRAHMVDADRAHVTVHKGRFDTYFVPHRRPPLLVLSPTFVAWAPRQATDLSPAQQLLLGWAIERRASHHERDMQRLQTAGAWVAALTVIPGVISLGGAVGGVLLQGQPTSDSYEKVAVDAFIVVAAMTSLFCIGEILSYLVMRNGEARCIQRACQNMDAGTLRAACQQLQGMHPERRNACAEWLNWGGDPKSYAAMAHHIASERLRTLEQQHRETV